MRVLLKGKNDVIVLSYNILLFSVNISLTDITNVTYSTRYIILPSAFDIPEKPLFPIASFECSVVIAYTEETYNEERPLLIVQQVYL